MVDLIKLDELQTTIQTTVRFSREFVEAYVEEIGEDHAALAHEMHEIIRVFSSLFQKWTMEIIFLLYIKGPLRFNDLKRNLGGISSRTLSRKLSSLTENGFINRDILDQKPVCVMYSLTKKGQMVSELAIPQIFYLRFPELVEGVIEDDNDNQSDDES